MKKFLSLLIALIISVFSAIGIADVTPVDRPSDIKVVEWAIGYTRRCRNYHGKLRTNYGKFVRKIAMAPLHLLLGTAVAESDPNQRYWSTLAQGGTLEEANAAYKAASDLEVQKPKNVTRVSHPRWAKAEPKRVSFLTAESFDAAVEAKRIWFPAARLDGFERDTLLVYQWFKPDAPKPVTEAPEQIVFRGQKYTLWCASQGGLKKGSAIYLTRKFLYTQTNGVENHIILDAPDDSPVNRINQIRALQFTGCEETESEMDQLIVFKAKKRIDTVSSIVDKRPVVHVDVPEGYKRTVADKVEQALDDGGGIYGPEAGITGPVAQLRNEGGMKCCLVKYQSKFIGKKVIDAFGCEVEITKASILSTTNNHKDIKPFLDKIEKGEMTGEEAKAAWLEANGGPHGKIYQCPIHPQNGRITLGRQIFGKFSQLPDKALLRVVSKDLGKLAMLGFESGYKQALQRKYRALKMPELANLLEHPLLYQDTIREYVSKWHKVAAGGVEVDGALAVAVIDPAWFDDVYVGGKSVDDPTAGIVAAGTILFGTPDKDNHNPYIGKKVVLGRFPQVKLGLPVVTIAGGAYASGIVVVSGRPGDMVLQDLDADLDGDKLYIIFNVYIVESVEKANRIFNFPHIIFSKWEASDEKETLIDYISRNAQWQNEESVGSFATHQFVINEMIPLLEDDGTYNGKRWESLLRPTLTKENTYGEFVTLEKVFECDELLGVGGNMATDSGKLNHKPEAPKWITWQFAFRPMSQRDAHPNAPDSGFKKRHEAFMPDKYPGVGTNILKRLHDLLMKYVPIEEVGKSSFNDFAYDDNDRIRPDIPKKVYRPIKFEPVPEQVWKHKFGNELDNINPSLVCHPDTVEVEELNADLQVFSSEQEISLVTYFTKYASRIVAVETSIDDDKKGWTVSARDSFGDNLILFVRTATKRKDISDEDCLWLAYNALCQSFIGTQSQSRGTSFAIGQFLNLFEGMLIEQVSRNTGSKPPKMFGTKVSIKDSVKTESTTKTDEEVPTVSAKEQTNETPPVESIDTALLMNRLANDINRQQQEEQEDVEEEEDDDDSALATLGSIEPDYDDD